MFFFAGFAAVVVVIDAEAGTGVGRDVVVQPFAAAAGPGPAEHVLLPRLRREHGAAATTADDVAATFVFVGRPVAVPHRLAFAGAFRGEVERGAADGDHVRGGSREARLFGDGASQTVRVASTASFAIEALTIRINTTSRSQFKRPKLLSGRASL